MTHARPDGDGLGSIMALHRSATAASKDAQMLIPDGLPPQYTFLFPVDRPAGPGRFAALADRADAIVIVDTCAKAQLDGVAAEVTDRREKVVVIDHHQTADDMGDVQWIDTTAAASAVMVGELLAALTWPVDRQAAEALFIAAATDTGWLRFANTDARCLRAVADWVAAGARPDAIYRRIYQNERPARLKLLALVLGGLQLLADDRLAVMTVRGEDFATTGARPEETENLVNEAFRIDGVEMAAMLVENSEGVRVSLRSREIVDVSAIAQRLGGGGHVRAAGVRLAEPMDVAVDRIIRAGCEALGVAGS